MRITDEKGNDLVMTEEAPARAVPRYEPGSDAAPGRVYETPMGAYEQGDAPIAMSLTDKGKAAVKPHGRKVSRVKLVRELDKLDAAAGKVMEKLAAINVRRAEVSAELRFSLDVADVVAVDDSESGQAHVGEGAA